MSVSQRAEWSDLREDLLRAEKLKAEGDLALERLQPSRGKWDDFGVPGEFGYLGKPAKASEPPKTPPKPNETEAEKLLRLRAEWEEAREADFRNHGIRW